MTQQAHDPSNPAPDAAAWHQQIAALIDHLDSGEFFRVLLQALAYQAPRLSTIIFLFRQRDVPQVVYHDVPAKEVGANIDSYVAGAYLLSPLYAAHQNNLHGFFRLVEIAPDDFFQSDYHRAYYLGTGLIDEAIYVVRLNAGSHIVLSLGRTHQVFSAEELRSLRSIEAVVLSLVRRHCRTLYSDVDLARENSSVIHQQVTHIFNHFGHHMLTARERDVAVLMLRGYSLKSAADALGIAFGTIKVHTKNLYAKIGINSQSELFSLFIEVMTRAESLQAEDPLQAYLESLDR